MTHNIPSSTTSTPPACRRAFFALLAAALLSLSATAAALFPQTTPAAPKPDDILPPWSEGFLDIHYINTGRGESALFILPDGTTLLVDAGVTYRTPENLTPLVPGAERTPGEWIARYIDRALQSAPKKVLNYVLLSHFHGDHYGSVNKSTKQSSVGDYKASGLTEVADFIPFEKFIDRAWPDYTGAGDLAQSRDSLSLKNYRQFLTWRQKHTGMKIERFKVAANDQIVLLNNPSKYPQFEIRNIAATGVVWTGNGAATRDIFKGIAPEKISENKCSIAFRLSYGPFKFFSGGDISAGDAEALPDETWRDIETPVAQATGPVHVAKANHHAFHDANSISLLRILRPRVIVVPTWHIRHLSLNIWSRMKNKNIYPGPRDIFATTITKTTARFLSDNMEPVSGHIVIRVHPGGKEYHVYRLTDSDESGRIKSVHGPYKAN